jgi:hypothetical protein
MYALDLPMARATTESEVRPLRPRDSITPRPGDD